MKGEIFDAVLWFYFWFGILSWGLAAYEAWKWRRHFRRITKESVEVAKKFQANLQSIQRAAKDSFSRAEVH